MTAPYFETDDVTLYVGDMREILPALAMTADLVLADPPYGETSLVWDRWPDGWLTTAATVARSLWCFGSMRMFLQHTGQFTAAGWTLSQDIVWEKNDGTGRATDRFRRVHEHALHWYQGRWGGIRHETPRVPATAAQIAANGTHARTNATVTHAGAYGKRPGWTETGVRLMRSVIKASTMRGKAIHPSEKPIEILKPLLEYACPPGGAVVDPFAGSGSTLEAARLSGRRAIGIEANEEYAERAARRLCQAPLDFGEAS